MYLNTEQIFRPLDIGPARATNRLMRSATAESAADRDGHVLLAPMLRIYGELARGGVGLIVLGHTFVHPSGRATSRQSGLSTDDHARAWEPVLPAIRKDTQAPLFLQLACAGRQGHYVGATPARNDGRESFPPPGTPINDYSARQIASIIEAFAAAAKRAAALGFDGVQIHMAHGYLLSECLSAHTNKRSDKWGGTDPVNRRRLPLAVIDAVKEAIGRNLALAVKLNGSDYLPPHGVEAAEAAETARQLEDRGVHLVEVSAGMMEAGMVTAQPVHNPDEEAYLLPLAREVAKKVRIPVATVGGYKSVSVMLNALAEGLDMVSLSRSLIREPDFPEKIRTGHSTTARCISCNKCFGIPEGAVRCMVDHPKPLES